MQLRDITAVGRPVDLHYPTNRAIAVLTLVVIGAGTGVYLLLGRAWLPSVQWGIGAGLAVFLAWALGREIDPDHERSAFVGAGLMVLSLPVSQRPALLLIFWLLLALRVVNRTTGLPARLPDSLALLGLGGWLVWQGQWPAGVLTVVAFLLDARLKPPLRRQAFFAALAIVVTVVLAVFNGNIAMTSGPSWPVIVGTIVVTGLFGLVIVASRDVTSVGDTTGEPLNARRVQAAQMVALTAGLALAWWQGQDGVAALLPMWLAMLGTALYLLLVKIRRPAGHA